MTTIAGHTFDELLLNDGVIVDVGCRDFGFTNHFIGKKVFCVDPDISVFDNAPIWPTLINMAISDKKGTETYYRNGESTCLTRFNSGHKHLCYYCDSITMEDLYRRTGDNVDLLKLDCEGAEYIILGDGFLPIPKQITVEFHHHCFPEIHDANIEKVFDTVMKYYDLVYQCPSGMDNLFIRK